MTAGAPTDFPVAARIGASGYAVEIDAGGHRLQGDEPESVGGTNTGPDPYALLLSALGTCTAMTLRMYADRKQWPLDGAIVTLRHRRIHAKDCDECETKTGKISRIDRVIELEGDLSDEQRERLMEIADKCPVHRTLKGEISIGSHEED
jgi:putative redox protein